MRKEVLSRNLLEKGELTLITMVVSADMIDFPCKEKYLSAQRRECVSATPHVLRYLVSIHFWTTETAKGNYWNQPWWLV